MTYQDRAVSAWADMHAAYLQDAHPDAWNSLKASGELAEHCRRRGVQAAKMQDRIAVQMAHDRMQRGDIIRLHTVKAEAWELVANFVRTL